MRTRRVVSLLVLVVACSAEIDDDHTFRSGTCDDDYIVVGSVSNGDEDESIASVVFTDNDPFECELSDNEQQVDFIFNASATDPVSDCTYTIERKHKSTGLTLSATETLDCGNTSVQYEVIATPLTSDPDCSGLSAIYVDPKIQISSDTSKPCYY